ncbi:MAG: hypothetical protein KGZ80_02230 [Methylomonas sp.]|nr:hypothetical protein [Methylomonas sp.]PPD19532.1 MAG: hypothetical protein CTY23_11540 [Methylomonas sp.]PPD23616.1 MAG: hypothetical protein CTY22_11965 [Methylomonas sp.]PPD31402.1 MAG: hypothetical protein CTY21_12150 [Methylomonas sp.]PPD38547.1 MAG: hypothetical protein CTY17_09200 [Methylomonas sp.]
MRFPIANLIPLLAMSGVVDTAHAIRPFVTDDARVVGGGLAQVESWLDGNVEGISHNVLTAIGPTDWLELTAGFVHGGSFDRAAGGYGISGPLFQFKALASEPEPSGLPGLALAAGVVPAFGSGAVKTEGTNIFGYLALTESLLNDSLLLHVNLGASHYQQDALWNWTMLGGFGFQQHLFQGLHAVAEVYHGDPYLPFNSTWETQAGFRYILNESVQFDGTLGKTLKDEPDRWWTLGIRLVSPPIW